MREKPLTRMLLSALACIALACSVCQAVDIEAGLKQLIDASELRGVEVGVMVVDLTGAEVLAELNADEPLIPASNMKLLTTATALDALGPDFVFGTELRRAENADGTTDLIIRGDGDPAFGDPQLLKEHGFSFDSLLAEWVKAVRSTGTTTFDRLIVDDRVLDHEFTHPTWPKDQLVNRWCAEVAGINFHDNVINVLPTPTRSGSAPRINVYPYAEIITTRNRATTGRNNSFWAMRPPDSNQFTFRGSVRVKPFEPFQFTIHDPPLVFAHVLRRELAQAGIRVNEVVRADAGDLPDRGDLLHVIRTTLPLVLRRTNRDSQNMFAEALFKRAGFARTGRPGSFVNGAAAMRIVMRKRLGAGSASLAITDGSGMSRENRVTPRLIVTLLASLEQDERLGPIYRESLAFSGRDESGEMHGDGTIHNRAASLRPASHLKPGSYVYGKSGYLNGVSALSGYLEIPGEGDHPTRVVAFSMLFNGFKPPMSNRGTIVPLQNKMLKYLDETLRHPVSLGG